MADESEIYKHIARADIDPEVFNKLSEEGFTMDDEIDDVDETTVPSVMISEDDYNEKNIEEEIGKAKGKDVSKVASDIEDMLKNPSASTSQMKEGTMSAGKEHLEKDLKARTASTEEETRVFVTDWAKASGRKLTPGALKGLANALAVNSTIGLEHLQYILLGWELRGEHNVDEVRNVMDSHQKLLNEVLGSQKEFRNGSQGLLSGIKDATTKLLGLAERVMQAKPQIILPRAPATQQAKPSAIPILGSSGKATEASLSKDEPLEKNYKNLLLLINREPKDFYRFVGVEELPMLLTIFVNKMSLATWTKLSFGKGKDPVLVSLAKFLAENKKAC